VKVGETLREAVVREVLEETGLDVRPMELVGAYDSIVEKGGGDRFHFVLLDFLCRIVGGQLRPGSDASATEWVPVADLEEVDLTPLARTAVLEAVRLRDRPDRQ